MTSKKAREPRKPLAFPPSYGTVEPGVDAYLDPLQLRSLTVENKRFWSFYSAPTTVALPGNRYAKSLKPFTSHETEPEFRELLAEYAEHNVPRPSGYADVFHEKFRSPRVSWSVNAMLAPAMAGGWQASLKPGRHPGTFYRYDMRSAYLWAATLGLPDTRTYRHSLSPWKNANRDGIYRIKVLRPTPGAPFPFDRAMECLASNLEIETYGLPVAEVIDGVTWKRSIEPNELLRAINAVSTWKLAGRSYWGRWAQSTRVMCHSATKKWSLPSVTLNIPWAHAIVSRVKMRLWENASNAVHVFVDSVITTDKLRTGDSLGDWRLEKTYHNGVNIKLPGQYGALDESRLEKMSGAPLDSPLRNTA